MLRTRSILEFSWRQTSIFAPASLFVFLVLVLIAPYAVFGCDCNEVTVPHPQPDEFGAKQGWAFYHSPKYRQEFAEATSNASKFCQKYKLEHPEKVRLAVVSDIDDTILDNSEAFKSMEKMEAAPWWAWVDEARAAKLKETTDFLASARKQGYCIFLVTGRHEKERVPTIINLNRDGIAYDGLYLRPNDQAGPAEQFKAGCREQIENMGFTIVENIGDQYSDLAGGHSLDCQKLPNKFYFIP
jgi:acid phosphatase